MDQPNQVYAPVPHLPCLPVRTPPVFHIITQESTQTNPVHHWSDCGSCYGRRVPNLVGRLFQREKRYDTEMGGHCSNCR